MNKSERDRIAVRDGLYDGLKGVLFLASLAGEGTLGCVIGNLFYQLFVVTKKSELYYCGGVHRFPKGQGRKRFIKKHPFLSYIPVSEQARDYLLS